tara:strand:- start:579 stop:1478 length:900 start_codon:yes stop_codon:yes gene_type:complete
LKKKLAPIVLFVYNRLNFTKRTLEALQKNELANKSELFIYSDAAKNENDLEKVAKVREYIKNIGGFKKIITIKRKVNTGLAPSIINAVTKIVNKYGKIIVLEDDLVTSRYFLRFMNEALEAYKNEPKVASIHGYIYPITNLPETFFIKGADCWGWATWNNKWSIFERDGKKLLDKIKKKNIERELNFNGTYDYTSMLKNQIEGKIDSWAIRWYVSAFLKNMITLYPGQSYVQNIGFGKDSTHTKTKTNLYKINLVNKFKFSKIPAQEDLVSQKKIENFFRSMKMSFIQKIKFKIIRYCK